MCESEVEGQMPKPKHQREREDSGRILAVCYFFDIITARGIGNRERINQHEL